MRIAAIGLCAVILSGCNQAPQDERICSAPPRVQPGQWGACIHKWSYRLAGAPGSNTEIARAAVNACADAIAYQFNAAKPDERNALLEAINRSAPEEALFRVVQARAGRCAIPAE